MSYQTLQIWQQAQGFALDIHIVSLSLPKFELYDRGSQTRRSSKLIRSNIVEATVEENTKPTTSAFSIMPLLQVLRPMITSNLSSKPVHSQIAKNLTTFFPETKPSVKN